MNKYDHLSDTQKQNVIQEMYVDGGLSFQAIAKKYETYPNKILRDAKKFNIEIRSKSAAQKNALKNGVHKHPTMGRKRTQTEKDKIGMGVMKTWSVADDKTILDKQKKAKKLWEKKTDEQKTQMLQKANIAVRESSKKGSKMEHFILNYLVDNGIKVDFHKEQFLVNTKLQIDLFLPKMNIAIEVDGPSHFRDVWGVDVLKRNQEYDAKKTGLILGKGYKLVRVKQYKDFSKTRAKLVCDKLLHIIDTIDNRSKVTEIEDTNA